MHIFYQQFVQLLVYELSVHFEFILQTLIVSKSLQYFVDMCAVLTIKQLAQF